MSTPITFRGYHPGNGDVYLMPDRITHFDCLERGGMRIVLDTGKEVWVDAWPQDVAKAIAEAQRKEDVAKLVLKPGDVLAVHVDGRLTVDACKHLKNWLAEQLPPGIHTLLLERGMSLQVLEQAEGEVR